MIDERVLRKILAVLRLGDSPIPAEADAALSKGIALMDAQGVTIETLLERIDPASFPQGVCAELARRYCLSRPHRSSSERDEYYRRIFFEIARKFSPKDAEKRGGESPGARAKNPNDPDPDFVRRMDEERRKWEAERARQDAAAAAERARQKQAQRDAEARKRRVWPRISAWRIAPIRNEFLRTAFRTPFKTVGLFAACLLAALIPGIVTAVILAGTLRFLEIHAFDTLHWTTVLGVTMVPFVLRKGRVLYRSGWFFR